MTPERVITMAEDEPDYRTYWHSDHYRNQTGNSFIGPIWDVLKDHPEGVTVPQIRDALVNDRRIRAAQSWLISFGAEQRHRQGNEGGSVYLTERYRRMDPDAVSSREPIWDAERRYRYALTERIHDQIRTMVKNGQAVVGEIPSDDKVSNSEVLYLVVGTSRPGGRHGNRLPLYTAGEIPLVTDINPMCQCGKVHHPTFKRPWVHHEGLGPDPYVLRENLRVEIENALIKERIGNARELLQRALDLMQKD